MRKSLAVEAVSTVLFLDRRDAAKACGVSVDTLDAAVRTGALIGKKHNPPGAKGRNTKVVFRPADLEAWVDSWDDT